MVSMLWSLGDHMLQRAKKGDLLTASQKRELEAERRDDIHNDLMRRKREGGGGAEGGVNDVRGRSGSLTSSEGSSSDGNGFNQPEMDTDNNNNINKKEREGSEARQAGGRHHVGGRGRTRRMSIGGDGGDDSHSGISLELLDSIRDKIITLEDILERARKYVRVRVRVKVKIITLEDILERAR